MRAWQGRVALIATTALVAACSSSHEDKGTCKVQVGTYIGETTGYLYDEADYCATQTDCNHYCDQVKNQPSIGGCTWDSFESCTGALPAAPTTSDVCAIDYTINCGGGSPSTSTMCPNCDVAQGEINKSNYDPGTDCLSQYGGKVGRGKTCDEATANLHK